MHSNFYLGVALICAAVILFRSIQIAAHLDWKQWKGHPLQFIGNSIAYPFLAGGSLCVLLERRGGFLLLLIGVMFLMLSDRRRAS
jgi:hypothetical protein